jgi:hypothetical protein
MLPKRHTVRLTAPLSARRARWIALALAILTTPASTATAEDWVFRRSYYSHTPPPVAEPRGPVDPRLGYREAFVGAHPRGAIRAGWRWNNITVSNGYSVDRTMIRESFFDANY